MFGRSGNSIRHVLSRRPSISAVSKSYLYPALTSTSMFARLHTQPTPTAATAARFSTHKPVASSPNRLSSNQNQRRYQSGPALVAAARQVSSQDVNITSQFPGEFNENSVSSQQKDASKEAKKYAHHVTMVKKVKADGSPCRKCVEVLARIETEGFMHRIDRIVIADEKNPMSEGMQLAKTFDVNTAPFFLVDSNVDKNAETQLYKVYFKLKREILAKDISEEEQLKDIQQSSQAQEMIDFI